MNPNYKDSVALTDSVPQSQYSGLSDLPEVKNTMAWLTEGSKTGGFRDMLLDDVIPQRKELPEWSKSIEEKTLSEVIAKTVAYDGSGEGMNKVGEFFYSVKDSFVRGIENTPTDIMRFIAAQAKTAGVEEEGATELLNLLDDVKTSQDFEKVLRDFRLGVDSDFISNEIADVFGQMGTILLGGSLLKGAGVGAKAAAGAMEGLAEGGAYLATDIAAQRQREGGLKEYKGEGLGFATIYGTLAGIIGAKGVEADFLDKMGKFTGKQFVKGVAGEAIEEITQTGLERVSRRAQNEIYGTDTDYQTWGQDVLTTLKAGLLGGIGGATIGGIAFVNNRNRAIEILQDNFGLTKADAKMLANDFIEMSAKTLEKNTTAMADLSPKSRVMQYARQTLIQNGLEPEQADKVLANMRKDIIRTQVKSGEPLSDHEFFQLTSDEDITAYVRNRAGIQESVDSVIEEEKQAISERRAELEQQEQPTVKEVSETVAEEESVAEAVTEEKPKATPVQLELNFLNAQENAINQANGINAPVLPVQQDLLTQKQLTDIQNKVEEIDAKVEELGKAKTKQEVQFAEVGQELNKFGKGIQVKSKFAERVQEQTGTKLEQPKTHEVRDIKAAKTAADELVATEEDAAWEMLENSRADTRGLLYAEIAEALKRKIAKNPNAEQRQQQLRRLITLYSDVSTRAGQELRALADDSLVNAVRDVAEIERNISKRLKATVKNKSARIQKTVDKITKSDRIISEKKFWEAIRENMECR